MQTEVHMGFEKVRQEERCLVDFRKQTPYSNTYSMGEISFQQPPLYLQYMYHLKNNKSIPRTVVLISRTRRGC